MERFTKRCKGMPCDAIPRSISRIAKSDLARKNPRRSSAKASVHATDGFGDICQAHEPPFAYCRKGKLPIEGRPDALSRSITRRALFFCPIIPLSSACPSVALVRDARYLSAWFSCERRGYGRRPSRIRSKRVLSSLTETGFDRGCLPSLVRFDTSFLLRGLAPGRGLRFERHRVDHRKTIFRPSRLAQSRYARGVRARGCGHRYTVLW